MILEKFFKVIHVLEVGTLVGLFLYFSYGAYVNYQDVPLQKTDKIVIDAVNDQILKNTESIPYELEYPYLKQQLEEYGFTEQYPVSEKSDYYLYSCLDKQVLTELEFYNRWDYTSATSVSYSFSTIDFNKDLYQPKIQLQYPTWSKDYYVLFPQYSIHHLTSQIGNPEIIIEANTLEKNILADSLCSSVFYNGEFFTYTEHNGKYIYTSTSKDDLWLDKTLWVLNSVTEIPENFVSDTLLRKVILNDNISTISGNAFKNCIYLEDIVFPNNLKTIKKGAFAHCIALYDLDFPKGLTSLEKDSFQDCLSLMRVYIPSSLIDSDPEAISGFGKQMVINTEGSYEEYSTTVFPNLFKNLENQVFYPNDNPYLYGWVLTEINEENKTFSYTDTIGYNNTIWLGSMINANDAQYRNAEIKESCCENLTSIRRIYIQPEITKISKKAFYHTSAEYIYLPATVTTIEEDAFGFNYRLRLFEVENTSTHFASIDGALYQLDKDKATLLYFPSHYEGDYKVPEKFDWNGTTYQVTAIKNQAFDHCYRLKNLTISSNISYSSKILNECPNTTLK